MVSLPVAIDGTCEESVTTWPRQVHLSAGGISLVLLTPRTTLPSVMYWGPELGDLDNVGLEALEAAYHPVLASNGVDAEVPVTLIPEGWTGWTGTPGLAGHRKGTAWSPRFEPSRITRVGGSETLSVVANDPATQLELDIEIQLNAAGLLVMRAGVRNLGDDEYTLEHLNIALPVPDDANEILDLAGRWAKERVPQRRPFTVGTHLREGRHGRTGADAATILVAGEAGFGFDSGRVWGAHLAFSGNHRVFAERQFTGEKLLYAGEALMPGEVILATGERYQSPKLYAAHAIGLDEMAGRFHDHLRARPQHPQSVRPVVMNVWEAVYFDHDLERIIDLATLGASVGAERFVLDDGWFGNRTGDSAGLGDWTPREAAWGEGRFGDLVRYVKNLGMQFGLWFEPEMINEDSDLARAHPEWIMQVPGRLPVEARHQQVLDLTHPDAFAYIKSSIVSLVRQHGIDFIKWDHNRDLVDAGSTRTGRAGIHEQTLRVYKLLDAIRAECPGLEIESCSSGGARVDLEILERADRVWASDCIDAHERQGIQRWTMQLLPPELIGSHVGAERAHTTGRKLDLSFRAATALFGHFGIEWDLSAASSEEIAELARWVDLYKRHRPLIHTGRVIRRDHEDRGFTLLGAIRPDRAEALFAITVVDRPVTWPAGRVQLPGLDPARLYRVRSANPRFDAEENDPRIYPEWWGDGLTVRGDVLNNVGVQVPALNPDHTALLHVTAAS